MEIPKCLINVQDEYIQDQLEADLHVLNIDVELINITTFAGLLSKLADSEYKLVIIDQVIAQSLKDVIAISEETDTIDRILYIATGIKSETVLPTITVVESLEDPRYEKWLHQISNVQISNDVNTEEENQEITGHTPISPKTSREEQDSKSDECEEPQPKESAFNIDYYITKGKEIKLEFEPPFYKSRLDHHKVIGIWSPETAGVTTFVENFAIFLAKLKFSIGVLEAITPKQTLEILLSRYNEGRPSSWKSLGSYLMNNDIDVKQIKWEFEGVHWYPFGLHGHDHRYQWNSNYINIYMNALRFYDILFVDLPSRDMAPETLEAVSYLDELWVMVNDRAYVFKQYKKFIHDVLIQKKGIPCKLIFNEASSFSEPQLLEETLELPLLGTIPAFHPEVKTYNDKVREKPLLFHPGVSEVLQHAFIGIAKNAFQDEISKKIFTQFTIEIPFWKKWVRKMLKQPTSKSMLCLNMIEPTNQMKNS